MRVRVLFFAFVREIAGCDGAEIDLPEGATVAGARDAVAARFPALAPRLPHLLWAVDREYARLDAPLHDGAEVAAIPPVSGG